MSMTEKNMRGEVREARAAGIQALNSLRRAQDYLNRARTWGVLDMFGGGLITSVIKHSRIGDAQHCIEQASNDLERFRRELADVDLPFVQINGFLSFADCFFDSFLADFLVQHKINENRARLEEACGQIEAILRLLPDE